MKRVTHDRTRGRSACRSTDDTRRLTHTFTTRRRLRRDFSTTTVWANLALRTHTPPQVNIATRVCVRACVFTLCYEFTSWRFVGSPPLSSTPPQRIYQPPLIARVNFICNFLPTGKRRTKRYSRRIGAIFKLKYCK